MSTAADPNLVALATRKYAWRYVGHHAFWIQRLAGVAPNAIAQ